MTALLSPRHAPADQAVGLPVPAPPPTGPLAAARAAAARHLLDLALRRVGVDLVEEPASTAYRSSGRPTIVLHRPAAFYARLGAQAKVAVGEGYTEGEWSPAPGWDLVEVLLPFAARLADVLPAPLRAVRKVADQPVSWALRNTLTGARRNVRAHYDLSNDLFAAFLDPSMSYSSALFDETRDLAAQDLEEAQQRKVDAALDRAGVTAGTRLLELGTGWGTLALRAAARGAHVTTVTLSEEQAAYARARVAEAGLGDRVDVRIEDYREVEGVFDAIVSIEMVEAVGEEYWPTYLEVLDARLAAGGRAVVQVITMPHERFLSTRGTAGWITRYIFPGGALPSVDVLERIGTARTSLRVREVHAFGQHYAETLRRWRSAFLQAGPQVERLGFDQRFGRIWEFYLAYCQAGFTAGAIDVAQLVLDRPPRGPVRA